MSIEDNIRIVKEFFAAIAEGDMAKVRALADDDIEWIIPGKDWPLAGTRHGHAGLQDLFQTHARTVETTFMEPRDFVAQGDRVLVVGTASGKIKATDKAWVDNWVFDITVRDGKIVGIREFVDTQALAQASSGSPGRR